MEEIAGKQDQQAGLGANRANRRPAAPMKFFARRAKFDPARLRGPGIVYNIRNARVVNAAHPGRGMDMWRLIAATATQHNGPGG